MNKGDKNRHVHFIWLLVLLAAVFCFFRAAPDYRQSDDVVYSVEDMTAEQADDQDISIVEDEADTDIMSISSSWKSLSTEGSFLEKGNYTFKVRCSGDTDRAVYRIYSDKEMNTEGEMPAVYAQGILSSASVTETFSDGTVSVSVPVEMTSDAVGVSIEIIYDTSSVSLSTVSLRWPSDCDWLGYFIFFAILIMVLYYLLFVRYTKKEDSGTRVLILTLTAAMLYMCLPMANSYYVNAGHDSNFHITRIQGIYTALRDGQIPMWLNMWEWDTYGYATPIMYPQLFLYIPALFHLAGMSQLNSLKLFLCLLNFATVLIAYFSFKHFFSQRKFAVVATLSYSLSVYYFTDLYTRCALGELQAMIFAPMLMAGCYEIFFGDEKQWPLLVFGATGVLQSHVLSMFTDAFIAGVIFLCYLPHIVRNHFGRRCFTIIKCSVTAGLINLFFLIPFLDYSGESFMVSSSSFSDMMKTFADNGIYFDEQFAGYTEMGNKNYGLGTSNEISLSVGFLSLVVLVSMAILLVAYRRILKKEATGRRILYIGIGSEIGAIVMLYMSSWMFPWDKMVNVPVMKYFLCMQFPWRFLGQATLFIALATGCLTYFICWIWKRKNVPASAEQHRMVTEKRVFLGICSAAVCLIWLNSFYYLQSYKTQGSYSGKSVFANTDYTDDLYLYAGNRADQIDERGNAVICEDGSVTISNFKKYQTDVSFQYQLPEGTNYAVLSLPLNYYPGYTAEVNGKTVQVQAGDGYFVKIQVTGSEGTVHVYFKAPRIWEAACWVSIISFAGFNVYLALRRGKRRREQTGRALL